MRSDSIQSKAIRIVIALLMVVTLWPTGGTPASAAPQTTGEPPFVQAAADGDVRTQLRPMTARRVVVQWMPGIPRQQIEAAGKRLGFQVVRTSQELGWALVEPTERRVTPDALIGKLREARLTLRAEPERVFQPQAVLRPNDPQFNTLWGLENTGQTGGTADADIDATEAWSRLGTGSAEVVVAVIDTGVDITHPDLRGNRWVNQDEIPNNNRDDDRNGYVDDRFGYDFFNRDATVFDPADGDQHGTHVAGTIGAVGDNGIGVAGVNWDVTLMPVKFLGPWGGTDFDGAEAIVYAVDNGADIINASFGGGYSEIMQEAIEYAAQHGVLFVAAAGNWEENVDELPDINFPASSESTNVITVAATDDTDALAWFSNFGRNSVEVAAPGMDINSTVPWSTSALFIDSPQYRLAYLAMAVESIESTVTRNDIITRSVAQVGARSTTPIIVVDDSMPVLTEEVAGERLQVYLDTLAGAGYTNVSTWNTESQGVPTRSALKGRVVLWFTGATAFGWYGEPTLDEAERAVVGHFLDNGGRMVMASGEIATDLTVFGHDYEWFEKYFKSFATDFWIWGYEFRGMPGTPFAGIAGSFPERYKTPDEKPWPTALDSVFPTDPSARPMLQTGGYGKADGTSMAAPHVAGALALLQSHFPQASPDELKARLENTVDRLPHLANILSYGGRINIDAAASAYPGRPTITSPRPSDLILGGGQSAIRWTPAVGGIPNAVFEVEQGLPAPTTGFDFEAGDLSAFETTGSLQWEITEDVSIVHSGTRSLRSVAATENMFVDGSIATTVTMASEGSVEFWVRHDTGSDFSAAGLAVNGRITWETADSLPWTKVTADLHEGPNRLEWLFINLQGPGEPNLIAIDDIQIHEYQYSAVGTAPAGAREIAWSVPSVDTDQKRIRVRAVADGVSSLWATTQGFRITTDGEAPGTPASLIATPGIDGDVGLSWQNPTDADFESVRVLRRSDAPPLGPNDPAATVVYEGMAESARQTQLVDGSIHHFAVFARDANNNWSDGAHAEVTAVDTVAPEAPQQLEARTVGGAVVLTWVLPEEGTYSGVRVVRRTDAPPTGPNDPAAGLVFDGPGAWASDWALADVPQESTKAYYAAWSYDASENLSEVVFEEISVDTLAPEGELLLNDGAAHTTSPIVRADSLVTGATEMRFHLNGIREDDEPWKPFAATTWLTLLDLDGPQTVIAEYKDASGNITELQAEIYVNLDPPAAPTGLSASPWGSRIELVWDDPRAPVDPLESSHEALPAEELSDVVGWNIYIGNSENGPFTQANEVLLETPRFLASSLKPGKTYWFKLQAVDAVELVSPFSDSVSITAEESVDRRSGADRFATAVEISKANWDQSDTVILASGAGFADALGASSLAGVFDAPILLTQANVLPSAVAAEIERLGATRVIIVGGTGVVGSTVETALKAKYAVERIGGGDRYETSALIAERVVSELGYEYSGEVFVASGLSHADALSIAPFAFSARTPVLLVDRLPRPVIDEAVGNLGAVSAVVVGGSGAVPEVVAESLGIPFIRIAGADRFATAVAVAQHAVDTGWGTPDHIGITVGTAFPDAIAGGPAVGRNNGLMLLTRSDALPEPTVGALYEWAETNRRIDIFGGTGAVSNAVRDEIRNIVR
ncbi:MAG: S8 family serine peptidase [Actinobacteria bacterium]|nr:S8 family serine peptidase [Actinomycetota bacterium]